MSVCCKILKDKKIEKKFGGRSRQGGAPFNYPYPTQTIHRRGFSLIYPFFKNFWTKGSVALGRYKIYDDTADYNNLVTSSLGVTWQPRRAITVDIEGQGLKNELTKTDFRLFARFNYWFFSRKFSK